MTDQRTQNSGRRQDGSGGGKDSPAQLITAIVAAAALIASLAGLVWAKQSADAARQSARAAAQANRLASQANRQAAQADNNNAQQQASGQASRVTLYSQRNGTSYSLLIENHSAGSIQDVFFTYGPNSTPAYYVNVSLIAPCTRWEASEEQNFYAWLYFEDSSGNYWEIDTGSILHRLAGRPNAGNLTQASGSWSGQETPLSSC